MNKIILTDDRLFMALVSPGGSGKLVSFIRCLPQLQHFIHPSKKTSYFYKEYQPLFQEMTERLNIEFTPCLDFEMTEDLENGLLVFDDSLRGFTKNKR